MGLLVLSPSFFAKEWPQRELDGLFAAEIAGQSRLIPVWYQIDLKGVAARSPMMADRLALSADLGIAELAKRIAELYPPPPRVASAELAQRLEHFKHFGLFAGEALYAGCWYRFLQMNAFKEEYQETVEELTGPLSDEEIAQWPIELEGRLHAEEERLRLKYRLSADLYLTTGEPIRDSELGWWKEAFAIWSSGTMSQEESAEFVSALDLEELDEYFILLEVPNFLVSGIQRDLLGRSLIELGCSHENEGKKLDELCAALRADS